MEPIPSIPSKYKTPLPEPCRMNNIEMSINSTRSRVKIPWHMSEIHYYKNMPLRTYSWLRTYYTTMNEKEFNFIISKQARKRVLCIKYWTYIIYSYIYKRREENKLIQVLLYRGCAKGQNYVPIPDCTGLHYRKVLVYKCKIISNG